MVSLYLRVTVPHCVAVKILFIIAEEVKEEEEQQLLKVVECS